VYVLPFKSSTSTGTTHLFMFNCDNGAVMRLTPGNTWSQYRDIPASLWPTPGVCGAMSMAGTATMLLLEPADGYAAEVAMFGGFQRGTREFSFRCCWADLPLLPHKCMKSSMERLSNMSTDLFWCSQQAAASMVDQCSQYHVVLTLRWGSGPMALLLWLEWVT
jgi:hypothetical protein